MGRWRLGGEDLQGYSTVPTDGGGGVYVGRLGLGVVVWWMKMMGE